jgi:hypothetical protein
VVKVDCQVHTIEEWRERWAEIAKDEGVEVSAEQVAQILDAARAARENS